MWYDTFLFQLQSFVDMFNGATFYWGNLINGTTITILLCAIFTIAATIAMIVNGTASSEVKLGRAFNQIKMFMARFGVIQKGNFIHFNKLCLRKMPAKVKKSCIRFIFNPTTQSKTALRRALINAADRSCTNAFIAYIIVYGLGAILAIATIGLETFYLDGNNLLLAVSLFYGASILIVMALQTYYISNKYKDVDMQIYSEIVSRYVGDEQAEIFVEKAQSKTIERAVDSIDELRRIVYGLIESGASKELLSLFKDGLMSVASTNYNSTADQLRLENIVSRINSYIAWQIWLLNHNFALHNR